MNKKIIAGILIVALIIIAVFFLFPRTPSSPIASLTPFEKLEMVLQQQTQLQDIDSETRFRIDISTSDPSLTGIASLLSEVDFVFRSKQSLSDTQNIKAESILSLIYQDSPALTLNTYMDSEQIVLKSNDLFSKAFYLSFDQYESFLSSTQMPVQFELERIIERSLAFQEEFYRLEGTPGYESFDQDKYRDMIESGLSEILSETEPFEITIDDGSSTQKVLLSGLALRFNDAQLAEFLLPILREAQTDEGLKQVLVSKLDTLLAFSVDLYAIDSETLGTANPHDEISDLLDNFESGYEEYIEDIITQLEYHQANSQSQKFQVDWIIGINQEGFAVYQDLQVDMDTGEVFFQTDHLSFHFNTILHQINTPLVFSDYSEAVDEGINLVSLMENPDSMESQMVMMQLYGSVMQRMSTNPLFMQIIQEIGVY